MVTMVQSFGEVSKGRSVWIDAGIYLIFFLSGAAALIYEISWARQIGLLFGHTVHAASVVLASYFFGMAVGYLLGARWSTRLSPMLGYAIAETVVAVWAIIVPCLLAWSEASFIAAWMTNSSHFVQTLSRVVFCFVLLLPGTVALGVTLPMVAMVCSNHGKGQLSDPRNTRRVTRAYAINTTGALVGVLLATFYLLLHLGVTTSSYLAAGLSIFCSGIALLLHRLAPQEADEIAGQAKTSSQPHESESDGNRVPLPFWILVMIAGLSGFVTLGLQVLYTRMFSLVFHNSTYTFGIVIAVFLAALALGAALVGELMKKIAASHLIRWVTGASSLSIVVSTTLFVALTQLEYFSAGESFSSYLIGACGLVSLIVGPPILMLGMLLPLVWKLMGGKAGNVVGSLTAVNTLAAAGGAMIASFVMLPAIGLWESFVVMAGMVGVCSLYLSARSSRHWRRLVMSILFLAGSTAAINVPREVEEAQAESQGERIVQRWNSPYGWIDAVQLDDSEIFKIRQNLHYRFGRTGDNRREFRQAHIPLMLHPDPKEVLFMGLGTGLTAGGSIPHEGIQQIDVVELIPEVVEACRLLAQHNFNIIDHPRVKVFIDDCRHYLLGTDRQYDVIVSDLFVPWESESGYLYTTEHYQVARQRLKPGGHFCQWLPLFQLGEEEFEAIANSFASVFPHVTIWWAELHSSKPVIALVGMDTTLHISGEQLSQRLSSLWKNIGSTDVVMGDVKQFWELYQGDWRLRPDARLNSDEYPWVEFMTPVSNRQRRLLFPRVLLDYRDRVLRQLPREQAILVNGLK
tara:strand:- start:2738 stop:5137 length:2400 start_codon:yes stop_codon:yes gene_type:complete